MIFKHIYLTNRWDPKSTITLGRSRPGSNVSAPEMESHYQMNFSIGGVLFFCLEYSWLILSPTGYVERHLIGFVVLGFMAYQTL